MPTIQARNKIKHVVLNASVPRSFKCSLRSADRNGCAGAFSVVVFSIGCWAYIISLRASIDVPYVGVHHRMMLTAESLQTMSQLH
jgi:hypothetical protein